MIKTFRRTGSYTFTRSRKDFSEIWILQVCKQQLIVARIQIWITGKNKSRKSWTSAHKAGQTQWNATTIVVASMNRLVCCVVAGGGIAAAKPTHVGLGTMTVQVCWAHSVHWWFVRISGLPWSTCMCVISSWLLCLIKWNPLRLATYVALVLKLPTAAVHSSNLICAIG